MSGGSENLGNLKEFRALVRYHSGTSLGAGDLAINCALARGLKKSFA